MSETNVLETFVIITIIVSKLFIQIHYRGFISLKNDVYIKRIIINEL